MMKKLGIVGAILVAVLAIFAVVVALQPAEFQIERSAVIDAPPPKVFELVNNFHRWEAWSPWAKLDPAMTTAYEGPESGVGAIYAWSGNNQVGEGRMTITESVPSERIQIKLEFLKPFAATNTAHFTFTPQDAGTSVQWRMEGRNNFMAKAFCLFVDMDAMVGKDFEAGLASMKAAAPSGEAPATE